MDYNEYQQIMIEKELVTTIEAEQCLQNAMRLQNNIKNALKMNEKSRKLYPCDPIDDVNRMKNEKDRYILTAIKLSIPKSSFKNDYEEQWWTKRCKIIAERTGPDVASLYNL